MRWIAVWLVLTTSTLASGITLPPKPYDHEPNDHYGIVYAPPERLNQLCKPPKGMKAIGCTIVPLRMIYIDQTLGPKKRKLVLRHEWGHLNGWEHP